MGESKLFHRDKFFAVCDMEKKPITGKSSYTIRLKFIEKSQVIHSIKIFCIREDTTWKITFIKGKSH